MSFAGYVAHVDRAFAERAESTRGTVVGFARSGEALVRFRTARGEEITFRDTGGGRPPTRTVGESVEVLHDRWRPEDARVPGPFRTTVALGIALFGFTVSASGVRMLLRLRDE